MIIFFKTGRLGNQLFQYAAFKKFSSSHSLYLVGVHELGIIFPGVEIAGTTRYQRALLWIFQMLGRNFFLFAARRLRLIRLIEEHMSKNGPRIGVRKGLLKNIIFVDRARFQAQRLTSTEAVAKLCLREDLINAADRWLCERGLDRKKTFFVHVRRGDYSSLPARGREAVLPLQWYKTQMEKVRKSVPDVRFVIVTDDLPYVEELMSGERDIYISEENSSVDFALMTLCSGGILSASTFSWWAAFFARRSAPGATFVAPRYWLGHRRKTWIPRTIETDWLTYADVEHAPVVNKRAASNG